MYTKPCLKWVGGKTQILDKVLSQFPSEMENYHEICLGGGSVLLALLQRIQQNEIVVHGNVYAYDINAPLINVYKNIQNNHKDLYVNVSQLVNDYKNCAQGDVNRNPTTLEEAKKNRENYYYWIRGQYNALDNKSTTHASAMFLFLNKTCFRGLFRMGPNGFNVPYGHYKNPEVLSQSHLEEIHNLIQGVEFCCSDLSDSMDSAQEGDFMYIDPPYAPENTNSFVGYTADGFNEAKHLELFMKCHSSTNNGVKWLMSNADVNLVRTHFTSCHMEAIQCRRAINAKKPDAKTSELLIKN